MLTTSSSSAPSSDAEMINQDGVDFDAETKQRLEQLFRACDTRGTGFIGRDEIRELCAGFGIGQSDSDAIFVDLDRDGDGKIDFDDFTRGFLEVAAPQTPSADNGGANNNNGTFDPGINKSDVGGSHHNGNGAILPTAGRRKRGLPRFDTVTEEEGLSQLDRDRLRQQTMDTWQEILDHLQRNASHLVSSDRIEELNRSLRGSRFSPQGMVVLEGVIQDLITDVRRLRDENGVLESNYQKEKENHQNRLKQLEEEIDGQVSKIEAKVREQAREEADAERRILKSKMDSEMAELQYHLKLFQSLDSFLRKSETSVEEQKFLSQMKNRLEEASHENHQLRLSLTDTQTSLALLRNEMAQMRQLYEEKCKELHGERENMMEYAHEQDSLTRQLQLLHESNNRLQDMNDSLRNSLHTSHQRREFVPRFPLAKKGSIIGDYLPEFTHIASSARSNTGQQDTFINEHNMDGDSGASTMRSLADLEDEEMTSLHSVTGSEKSMLSEGTGGLLRRNKISPRPLSGTTDQDDQMSTATDLEMVELNDAAATIVPSSSIDYSPRVPALDLRSDSPRTSIRSSRSSSRYHSPVALRSPSLVPQHSPFQSMFEPTGPPERTFKVVFAGDAAVGKTSFILRISKGTFMGNLSSTLGVDFHVKTLRVDEKNITLQLWDTAGQERFRSITKTYFRRADGVMLLYDCTNERSFINVRQWMQMIDTMTEKRVPIILCANKTDMREVAKAEGRLFIRSEDGDRLAREVGAIYFEGSAKFGSNTLEAVIQLTREMLANEDLEVQTSGLRVTEERDKKSGACCGSKKS